MAGMIPGVVTVVPSVATAVLVALARVGQDVSVVNVLTTLGATASVVPDLPGPFPCTVMVMKTTLVDEDLSFGLVVVAVGAGATEVTAPSREGRTRAATTTAQAAIPSATRSQALAHRSPTVHVAGGIDEAVVLPVRPTPEANEAPMVSARRRAMGAAVVEGLAASRAKAPAATAGCILPGREGTFPTATVAVEAKPTAS